MSWLPEQVDSILAQEGVAVRLIISVDASDDGTEEWVDYLANEDPRVSRLPHGDEFGTAAGNFFRLLREADIAPGSYVALSDQDDLWAADKLERALSMLGAEGADAYSSNVTALWPDGRKTLVRKSQPQKKWDHFFEAAGPGCTYVFTPSCAAKLSAFVRGQEEALASVSLHDWLCYAYVRQAGGKWVIDEESRMLYRQHESNHVGVNTGWRATLERLRLVSGGWWLTQARLIADLTGAHDDAFVVSWRDPKRRRGYLFLAGTALQCRRRWRDAIFMAIMCLFLSLRPSRS